MNELLKEKAEKFLKRDKKYFSDLKDLDFVIIDLCDSLSSFGFYNENNELIEEELFNIFMYLFNYNNEKLEEVLISQNKEVNLYKDTLKVVNEITNCITRVDYLYEDIVAVCNGMTQKLYNMSYEEFLLGYINKKGGNNEIDGNRL